MPAPSPNTFQTRPSGVSGATFGNDTPINFHVLPEWPGFDYWVSGNSNLILDFASNTSIISGNSNSILLAQGGQLTLNGQGNNVLTASSLTATDSSTDAGANNFTLLPGVSSFNAMIQPVDQIYLAGYTAQDISAAHIEQHSPQSRVITVSNSAGHTINIASSSEYASGLVGLGQLHALG